MRIFKAILSVFLMCLVLVSSTSFMIGMHVCGGRTQNIALFTKAEACAMEKSLPPCHKQKMSDCCQDETVIHKGDDVQYSGGQIQIPTATSVDVERTLVLLAEVIPSSSVERLYYYNYDPPLRACDFTVEHSIFQI